MRRELSFLAVEENKIDIGTVIQFPPTELAHCEDGEFSAGRSVSLAQLRVPVIEDAAYANFCDVRQLCGSLFERRDIRHLAKRDPRHLAVVPGTKGGEITRREWLWRRQVADHFRTFAR